MYFNRVVSKREAGSFAAVSEAVGRKWQSIAIVTSSREEIRGYRRELNLLISGFTDAGIISS